MKCNMDTYTEFCIRFWEATRELDLYSMDGSQLDRLIVDALLKTNGGKELLKTSMNELSVLIRAINYNNRKIQQPSLPDNLDEAAREIVIKMHPCLKDCTILGDRLTRGQLMALVKAGAEWMAGQGETIEGEVVKDINNNLAITAKGFSGKEAVFGDKVIVQIRKKTEV